MGIKMVVTDLDGTLLKSDDTISVETRKVFKEVAKKGIIPVIATGRMEIESRYAAEAIGATEYMILMNGCHVFDYKENICIDHNLLLQETAADIARLVNELETVSCLTFAGNRAFCSQKDYKNIISSGLNKKYVEECKNWLTVVEDITPLILDSTIQANKFFINTIDSKVLQQIRNKMQEIKGVTPLSSRPTSMEIIPERVDKGAALLKLCDYLSIDVSESMVIGDSENDIGMLATGGLKVAVGNAYDSLKKIAHYVVKSNDEDGVAEAIKRFLL